MKKTIDTSGTYVALLRGINVGGNKKVPMADLKKAFEKMGFKNVRTILNTGNVVFEAGAAGNEELAASIMATLEKTFKFSVPVIVVEHNDIQKIINADPFKKVEVKADMRLYVTFLPGKPKSKSAVPYTSPDGSFDILAVTGNTVLSVLDVSISKTPEAMGIVEKEFGKNVTTRNWNTVVKIGKA